MDGDGEWLWGYEPTVVVMYDVTKVKEWKVTIKLTNSTRRIRP